MSQNSDYYHPFTKSSSSTNHLQNKRLSSHQTFLPPPSEFGTPSSIVNPVQIDSPSSPSYTSPIVSDVCMSSQNGVRNASTTAKVKDNGSSHSTYLRDKYAFSLNLSSAATKLRQDQTPPSKLQFHPLDMTSNDDDDDEDLHSPFELDVPVCDHHRVKKIQNDFLIDRMLKDDGNSHYSSSSQYISPDHSVCSNNLNQTSPLATPSSDHHDIDALSDAGTYIIDDDGDIARDEEPEQDIEQPTPDQGSVSSSSVTSPFKRYVTTKRSRHGTFDIHGISSNNNQTVTRPVVDSNVPSHDLSSPSSSSSSSAKSSTSSSSLLSLPTESDNYTRKEPEGASHHLPDDQSSNDLIYTRQRPNSLTQHKRPMTPPQNPIKPAECFVISPTFEAKPFPNVTASGSRRKSDQPWKPKPVITVAPTKDTTVEISSKKSPSPPPLSARSTPNEPTKYTFRLQQSTKTEEVKAQPNQSRNALSHSDHVSKTSLRPHTIIQDQMYSSSPFQRNSSIRQTMPAHSQYQRTLSASTTSSTANAKYVDDQDEVSSSTHPNLTKVYMNKSFALRRQRSNVTPATAKPVPPPPQQQQNFQAYQQSHQSSASKSQASRPASKPTPAVSSAAALVSQALAASTGQINRAVELRRARAQAKIEELAQRTRHQLQKTEHNDIMSASWHSNASSTSKKDLFHQRPSGRSTNSNVSSQKQDLLKTRTISSTSSHHRSSSASPNPNGEPLAPSRYRRTMVSSVTDESQYQKMNGSTYSEGERCDLLRDDGQRLAIKLIQLSSGILAKLKPTSTTGDTDSNVRELEQLVDKLQTVNRTLSTIEASLNLPTSDNI